MCTDFDQAYLAQVGKYCTVNKLNFTSNRRAVLLALLQNKDALSAYEVLALLQPSKASIKPPTVYRALAFLVEHHIVQHLESSSRYLPSAEPGVNQAQPLLICKQCHAVTQIPVNSEVQSKLQDMAQQAQFTLRQQALELHGLCQQCHTVPS